VGAQHVELARQVRAGEQVAGLRVLGDEAQRLPLATAANHDRRVRFAQRLWRVQRSFQLEVPAVIGGLVAAPHLQADLQRLLQPLEPLGHRRERDAQPAGLLLVPGRADAQPGPPAGQHVQGGHGLGEDARVPVNGAGHQGQQLGPRGQPGHVPERGVGLEHLSLRRPDRPDLEEVVHYRDEAEPGFVGRAGHGSQVCAQPGRAAGAGEVRNLHAELHAHRLRCRGFPVKALTASFHR